MRHAQDVTHAKHECGVGNITGNYCARKATGLFRAPCIFNGRMRIAELCTYHANRVTHATELHGPIAQRQYTAHAYGYAEEAR